MSERRPPRVEIRRVYDAYPSDGSHRVLIDRLSARGVPKGEGPIDKWAKDVAPSTDLRRWYGHDPAQFEEFARRYRDELLLPPATVGVAQLRALARRSGVVLVAATRDVEHSGAAVLLGVLTGPVA